MPGFDGTGPEGQGPMTGGARGLCDPRNDPNAGNVFYRRFYPAFRPFRRVFGRGRPRWGLGLGRRGRGRGRW
jgi:hypothetical protein